MRISSSWRESLFVCTGEVVGIVYFLCINGLIGYTILREEVCIQVKWVSV